jgi:hypothetical protein
MKVYHGSYMEINEIDLSKCQPNRDFGKGFYVTNIREQAEYWADRKGSDNENNGYVTEFTFYENAFEHYGLKVLRFSEYTEDWLDFIVLNRNPNLPIPAHDYDIVEGPVADDKVTRRIFAYMEGAISRAEFLDELKFFRHTHQIAFCTVESLQMLERTIKKSELTIDNIDDAIVQALVVDYGMTEDKAIDVYFESKIYMQLIDENTGLYNKPWTDIYKMLKKELKINQ